jgi:VCBS repeat-containing protein
MADTTLTRPAPGQQVNVPSAPGARIVLNFPADQATMERVGDNLVFRFDDGAVVELTDFYVEYTGETIPEFQVDGTLIAGADFFEAFGPDLAPAAGAGAAASGRYNTYATGDLADGLDHLNDLDYRSGREGQESEARRDYDVDPLPTGISISWNDAWTGGSSLVDDEGNTLATVVNGRFTLHESGLAGGTREVSGPIQASSTLHVDTQNSTFTGLTIDGTFYSTDAMARGVEIGLDVDGDGDVDVTVAFDYVGDNNVRVTVTLDNNVTHTGPDGANLQEMLDGLGITAHNNMGDSASAALSVDVVDDGPIAYDDADEANYGTISASGNVLDNDLYGADGKGTGLDEQNNPSEANDHVDWVNADGNVDIKFGDVELTRAADGTLTDGDGNNYGILLLDEDTGAYTYTKPVNIGADNQFEFTGNISVAYTIEDGDGDRSSAALTLHVEDAGITITDNDNALSGAADVVVKESGLAEGTDPGDSKTADGTFTINAKDGIETFQINGQDVEIGKEIYGDHGTLTITAISDPDDNGVYTVDYTYELTKAYDNTDTETADYGKDAFTITVTDSDGDTVSSPLVIAIEDDAPKAYDDAVAFTVEDADGNNVPTTVIGNVTNGAAISVSGGTEGKSSAGADLVGADANLTPVTWQTDVAATGDDYGLTQTSVPGEYNVVDAKGQTVGTLTLEADGGYTFKSNENYEPTSGDHVITIPYTVTDADGDTDKANLTLTIQNVNDAPVIIIDDGGDGTGGSVKEEGVWAAGDTRDSVNPDENTPTTDSGVAPGEHKIATSGTVVFYDAEDGDALPALTLEGVDSNIPLPDGYTAAVQGDYGILYMNLETGAYLYELDDRANGLNEGQLEQETFNLSVTDAANVTTNAAIVINVHGTNDRPTLSLENANTEGNIAIAFADNKDSEIYANKGFSGKFDIADPDADGAYNAADGSGADNFSFVLAHSGGDWNKANDVQPTGTVVGQPGQSVTIDGKYGSLTVDLATGEYKYELYPHPDPELVDYRLLADDLDYGQFYREDFTLTTIDAHGASSERHIVIDITGENESPHVESFQHDVYEDRVVYELDANGNLVLDADGKPIVVSTEGDLRIEGNALDGAELGDGAAGQHTFIWDEGQGIGNNDNTGNAQYGTFEVGGLTNPGYTYTLNNGDPRVQELRAGETLEETFTYTYFDKDGEPAQGKVTITIHGTNDQIDVTNGLVTAVALKEAGYGQDVVPHVGAATGSESAAGIASQTGTFTVHDPDANDDRFLSVTLTDASGATLTLVPVGKEVTAGDFPQTYEVTAFNPLTQQQEVIGRVTINANKVDEHDTNYSYTFTLDEEGADFLKQGDNLEYELAFTVGDGIGDDVEQKVTIKVEGTNDQPVLTLTNPNESFVEGEAKTSITGSFSVVDVDSDSLYLDGVDAQDFSYNISGPNGAMASGDLGGDVSYQGQYGTLTVHPDGTYEYKLDTEIRDGKEVLKIEGLKEGEEFKEHFDVSATDAHGATSPPQGIDITLTGKDDDPIKVGGGDEGSLSLKETGVGDAAHGGTGSSGYAANRTVAGTSSDSSDATEAFKVLDLDKNDNVTLTLNGNLPNSVSTSGATTTYTFATEYGTITVTGAKAADGTTTYNYKYALDNGKANSLHEGEVVEKDYVIEVGDGSGSTVKHTVHTTIEGTNDIPTFTGGTTSGTVRESGVGKDASGNVIAPGKSEFGTEAENADYAGALTFTGKLTATDADNDSDNIAGSDLVFGLIANGAAKDVNNITQDLTSDQATKVLTTNSVFGPEIANGLGVLHMDTDGTWTFTLYDEAAAKLAEGEFVTLSFTVTVTDEHGATAERTINVAVQGTNDVPTLTVGYGDGATAADAVVTEDGNQTVSGTIEWGDVDVKDMQTGHDVRISFTDANGTTTYKTDLAGQTSDNHLEIEGNYGTLYYDRGANNGQGEWTYILDNTKAQNLPAGEPAQEVFTVMVRDANGAWVEQPLVVNVAGTDDDSKFDLSALNPSQTVIEEGVAPGNTDYAGRGTASGDIRATDIDSGEQLTYSVLDKDGEWHDLSDPAEWADGKVTIETDHGTVVITDNNNDGSYHYVYTLDNDDPAVNELDRQATTQDGFGVKVTNQYGDEVEHPVNITIVGTNDRPTIDVNSPILLDSTDGAQVTPEGAFSGRIATSDIDDGHYGSSEDGTYNLSVSAVDAGGNLSSFVEARDGDGNIIGTFEVHKDGNYTFQLNDAGREALRHQGKDAEKDEYIDITVTVRVTDPQGGYSEKDITFRLSGTDDAPVLYEAKSVLIEDGALSGLVQDTASGKWVPNADDDHQDYVSGTLSSASVDVGHVSDVGGYHLTGTGVTTVADANSPYNGWETVANDYGTTYLNPDTGDYRFELNQDADAINALKPGESLGISIPVSVVDDRGLEGHNTISVTVQGTNDRPVLTAAESVTLGVAENNHSIENWTATGSVVATDADNISYQKSAASEPTSDRGVTGDAGQSEVSFCFIDDNGQPVQTLILEHGSVTIDARTGEYTYTFNVFDDSNYVNGKTPEGMSDSFTVYARDAEGAYSDPRDITVNIDPHDKWDTGYGGPGGGTGSANLTITGADDVQEDYGNVNAHGGDHVAAHGNINGSAGYFFIGPNGEHVQTVEGKDADGNVYGAFTINPVTGEWTFTLNNSTDLVQGMDGADSVALVPPSVSSIYGGKAEISFTVKGTADRPDFDQDEYNKQVTEDEVGHTAQTVTGQLSAKDVDAGDNAELTYGVGATGDGQTPDPVNPNVIHGKYGDLTVNENGSYSYTIREGVNVPRGEHEEVFQVTVTDNGYKDADGDVVADSQLTDTAELTVRVTGLNTAPEYTGPSLVALAVTEDVFTQGDFVTAKGAIDPMLFTDNDGDAVHLSVSVSDGATVGNSYAIGAYGTLFIKPDGTYEYRLNNERSDVQGLKGGEHLDETFYIKADDGYGGVTSIPVTVNINGTEDAPELHLLNADGTEYGGGKSLDMLETDESVGGKAFATDVDTSDANNFHFSFGLDGQGDPITELPAIAIGGSVDGQVVGKFVIDPVSGEYRFIPNENIESLNVGEQIKVEAPVWVNADQETVGNSANDTVVVTITGTNSTPKINAVTVSGLVEDGNARVTGDLTATDADTDSAGQLQYYVEGGTKTGPTTWEGDYGTLTLNPDGSYTYDLHNDKVQGANVDNTLHDVFKVVAKDQYGATSEPKNLDFAIEGVNDLPVVSGVTNLSATESNASPTSLSTTGYMTVKDVDDTLTDSSFSVKDNGEGTYGKLVVDGYDAATGKLSYHYELDNAKADSLGRNDHPVENFIIQVDDGHGNLVDVPVKVTVNGANDAPTLDAVTDFSVAEATGAATGTPFVYHDVDASDVAGGKVSFVVDGAVAASGPDAAGYTNMVNGAHGTLYYNSATGENKYVPNGNVQENDTKTDDFVVRSYDGAAYSAGDTLTVTVEGQADAPVVTLSGAATLQAVNHETGSTKVSLPLKVVDPDANDTFTVEITDSNGASDTTLVGQYGTVSYVNGQIVYNLSQTGAVQALKNGETVTETFTVTVTDSTGNAVDKTVTFTVKGTNDTPVISDVQTMDNVTEDSGSYTTSGYFLVTDADDTLDTLNAAVSTPNGKYGSLVASYDKDGKVEYTYTLDNDAAQELGAGQGYTETFTIRVTDGQGGYTDQQVTVRVVGTNDDPQLAVTSPGSVELATIVDVIEDAANTGQATVTLNYSITDVDLNDTAFGITLISDNLQNSGTGSLAGQYGTLSVVNGQLVYTVDPKLGTGTNQQDVFIIKVADGHGGYDEQQVTFNVTSYNDAPTVNVSFATTTEGILHVSAAAVGPAADWNQEQAPSISGQLNINAHDTETAVLAKIIDGAGTEDTVKNQDGSHTVYGEYGTLTWHEDGSYTYKLNADLDTLRDLAENRESGLTDTFTFTVVDEEGQTASDTFDINIEGDGHLALVNELTNIYTDQRSEDMLILGTNDADRIILTGADNVIYSGGGDDVINVEGKDNQVFGGDGNDLVIFNSADGTGSVDGGEGIDFLVGLSADMSTVDTMLGNGQLNGVEVMMIGDGLSNINDLTNLGNVGLTMDGNKLVMDERWQQDDTQTAGTENTDGYTAYTWANENESMTILVKNEIIAEAGV